MKRDGAAAVSEKGLGRELQDCHRLSSDFKAQAPSLASSVQARPGARAEPCQWSCASAVTVSRVNLKDAPSHGSLPLSPTRTTTLPPGRLGPEIPLPVDRDQRARIVSASV
eukprot:1060564-Rhodomonas_salina.1